jgi:hypothetical protein
LIELAIGFANVRTSKLASFIDVMAQSLSKMFDRSMMGKANAEVTGCVRVMASKSTYHYHLAPFFLFFLFFSC